TIRVLVGLLQLLVNLLIYLRLALIFADFSVGPGACRWAICLIPDGKIAFFGTLASLPALVLSLICFLLVAVLSVSSVNWATLSPPILLELRLISPRFGLLFKFLVPVPAQYLFARLNIPTGVSLLHGQELIFSFVRISLRRISLSLQMHRLATGGRPAGWLF